MRFDTLGQWLAWQETCHSQTIDLGLERVSVVAERLGLKPAATKSTVITVAGTNGKGSCVRSLEALLAARGKSVGSYTSPHLLRYNERIRINGMEAEDEAICRAFHRIDQAREEISLSYFEFGTLAAMWLFGQCAIDYWLLEVGLGGRLDATNLLDADIAIITSVDIDHVEWLGNSRELIGVEKAGIGRPQKPMICVDPQPPESIYQVAQKLPAPLQTLNNQNIRIQHGCEGRLLTVEIDDIVLDLTAVLLPKYSVIAALMALRELDLLREFSREELHRCLNSLQLPGRMQLQKAFGHRVYLDVAHNTAAIAHCVQEIKARLGEPSKPGVDIVIAMMKDKQLEECVAHLELISACWLVCNLPGIERAATAAQLANHIHRQSGKPIEIYQSVAAALTRALQSSTERTILVVGSFLTVAAATEFIAACGSADLNQPWSRHETVG